MRKMIFIKATYLRSRFPINSISKKKLIMFFLGFSALVWFLIRVIPKPSRATYPCQRAAFPLASTFVTWLIGFAGSFSSIKKAGNYFSNAKYLYAFTFLLISLFSFTIMQFSGSLNTSFAKNAELMPDIPPIIDIDSDKEVVNPKATVAIVQSEKAEASLITAADIDAMVRKAVIMAGGFDTLIKNGQNVVIKPNLVCSSGFGKDANGQTTDWRIIQSVVNMVREKNPKGKILIMECSGEPTTMNVMRKMGILDVKNVDSFIAIEDSSGGWREYNSPKLMKVSLPIGKALFLKANNEYYFNKVYYDADVIIDLPVLKTHNSVPGTGAVKNIALGVMPWGIYCDTNNFVNPAIYPMRRGKYVNHAGSKNDMSDWLHDYYMARPVDFCIMDALTGLEYGPVNSRNNPEYRKNTRCIIAAKNAISMDAIEYLILQKDPARTRYLVTLHNDSLGCADPKYIRVKGIRVDQIREKYRNNINYADYTDVEPPAVTIDSYQVKNNKLILKLKADTKVEKVEISVNGQQLDKIYTKNFNSLNIDLGKKAKNKNEIKVFAYDHYLNCKVLELN